MSLRVKKTKHQSPCDNTVVDSVAKCLEMVPQTDGSLGHNLRNGQVVQLHVIAHSFVLLEIVEMSRVDVYVVQAYRREMIYSVRNFKFSVWKSE